MLLPLLSVCCLALTHLRQGSSADDCSDVPNCKTCEHEGDTIKCTECDKNKYLKTDENGDTECVSEDDCGAGYYPDSSRPCECRKCTSPCTACSGGNLNDCTACAEGYFLGADNNGPGTCYSCSTKDSTNGQWFGVENCAKCNKPQQGHPAICTECVKGYYLNTTDPTTTACLSKCPKGYYGTTDGTGKGTCLPCSAKNQAGLADCAECSYDGKVKCTRCSSTTYLLVTKTDTSCLPKNECDKKATHFPKEDTRNGNRCVPCTYSQAVPNCLSCSATRRGASITCTGCMDGYEVSSEGKCVLKGSSDCPIPGCRKCSPGGTTCEACLADHMPIPSKTACVRTCPPGTYEDNGDCVYCSVDCATCTANSEHACTSCPPGKVLKYAGNGGSTVGQCVHECTVGVDKCLACGATIGGTRYCSRCEDGYVPKNGECFPSTDGALLCLVPGLGTCTRCGSGFFPLGGGCYETSRQPGSLVCLVAGTGECTLCVNGGDPQDGTCPECPGNCAVCPGGTCTACYPGFYLSGSSCVSCAANSGGITGIPGCTSCSPPPSGTGPVVCYSDLQANRAGLRTGTIAGISVAAVLVVGGVAGFLCWWFICRSRASGDLRASTSLTRSKQSLV